MHLCVTRHGQTEYNRQGRYTGSSDIPLSFEGIEQAEALAASLKDRHFDVIVSSTLIRAVQTADIVYRYHKETPRLFMSEFAERDMGVYEGLTREEAEYLYPALWNSLSTVRLDGAPTGGETIRQVDNRVALGLQKLKKAYPGCSVLLVCHGFVARIIYRQVKGLDFEEVRAYYLDNCAIAEYEI
jgi:probable phosphoglycerate mutase